MLADAPNPDRVGMVADTPADVPANTSANGPATAVGSQSSAANQRPPAVQVSRSTSPAPRATSPIWSAPT